LGHPDIEVLVELIKGIVCMVGRGLEDLREIRIITLIQQGEKGMEIFINHNKT
jgi:hypothetical protein